jgi:hypothetical protein
MLPTRSRAHQWRHSTQWRARDDVEKGGGGGVGTQRQAHDGAEEGDVEVGVTQVSGAARRLLKGEGN